MRMFVLAVVALSGPIACGADNGQPDGSDAPTSVTQQSDGAADAFSHDALLGEPQPPEATPTRPDTSFILPSGCAVIDVPLRCEQGAADCGPASDGLGGLLQCGPCPAGFACTAGRCTWPADAGPCVPAKCVDYDADCGAIGDGCGGMLQCGSCIDPEYCGGGGHHRCGGACSDQPRDMQMDCGTMLVCVPDAVDSATD
jgi:hypothetical protein